MTKKGAFFNQTRNGTVPPRSTGTVLEEFEKFCRVDLRLRPESVRRHKIRIKQVLEFCGKHLTTWLPGWGSVRQSTITTKVLETLPPRLTHVRDDWNTQD